MIHKGPCGFIVTFSDSLALKRWGFILNPGWLVQISSVQAFTQIIVFKRSDNLFS